MVIHVYTKSVENNLITAVLSFTQCIKLTNIGETRPDICLRAIPRESSSQSDEARTVADWTQTNAEVSA